MIEPATRNKPVYSPRYITCDSCGEDFDDRLAEKVKRGDTADELVCPDCWDALLLEDAAG